MKETIVRLSRQLFQTNFGRKLLRAFFASPDANPPKKGKETVSWRTLYSVGRGTYGEPQVLDWGGKATLKIGAFCSIGQKTRILLGGGHRLDWITTYPFPAFRDSAKSINGHRTTKGDVIIGNDVWIGFNATILSGVVVGDGAVIGACSVVTKNVQDYEIVAGNPASPIRRRFSDEEIAVLKEIKWWDRPDAKIDEAMPLLLSGDVSRLLKFSRNCR